jgi:hypothetical protein
MEVLGCGQSEGLRTAGLFTNRNHAYQRVLLKLGARARQRVLHSPATAGRRRKRSGRRQSGRAHLFEYVAKLVSTHHQNGSHPPGIGKTRVRLGCFAYPPRVAGHELALGGAL